MWGFYLLLCYINELMRNTKKNMKVIDFTEVYKIELKIWQGTFCTRVDPHT